ncbi:RNA polymerase sigma factor, sigma-70 family, partial [Dysosmobacter welbionis]
QQDLRQNEQHIHQKSELSQRDGKAEAQHIGQAGDGGGPQRGLGNQGHAEGVQQDPGSEPAIAGESDFYGVHLVGSVLFRRIQGVPVNVSAGVQNGLYSLPGGAGGKQLIAHQPCVAGGLQR